MGADKTYQNRICNYLLKIDSSFTKDRSIAVVVAVTRKSFKCSCSTMQFSWSSRRPRNITKSTAE